MQIVAYKCDACKRVIGDKTHISLSFGNFSGIAVPPGGIGETWSVTEKLQGKFLHFCNDKCIGKYFGKLIEKVEKFRLKLAGERDANLAKRKGK